MQIKNTESSFGSVSKIFHWVCAILIIGLLAVGIYMEDMAGSPDKYALYGWHKSFGITVFGIGIIRVIWMLLNPFPHALVEKTWEKMLSGFVHLFLYTSLLVMPLSGWVMSSSGGYGVSFFKLFKLPALVGKDKWIHDLTGEIHEYLGYVLIAAIVLHILAALKHHYIDKDDTLRRMMCKKKAE